ncbi:MAG: DUF6691 family protein [Pseudomonadota bacterium]
MKTLPVVLAALGAGLLFGLGLIVSGMADPAKVQNFLDPLGRFDPSLAFVMGGAIAVTVPGFFFARRAMRPLFADVFQWPTRQDVDGRLLTGTGLFGIGWGLGGFCPGPLVASVPLMNPGTLVFGIAMLVGMVVARLVTSDGGLGARLGTT